jgi:hypothetical protein
MPLFVGLQSFAAETPPSKSSLLGFHAQVIPCSPFTCQLVKHCVFVPPFSLAPAKTSCLRVSTKIRCARLQSAVGEVSQPIRHRISTEQSLAGVGPACVPPMRTEPLGQTARALPVLCKQPESRQRLRPGSIIAQAHTTTMAWPMSFICCSHPSPTPTTQRTTTHTQAGNPPSPSCGASSSHCRLPARSHN